MDFHLSFEIELDKLNIICNERKMTARGFLNYAGVIKYTTQSPKQIINKQLKIISCSSYKVYIKTTDEKFYIVRKTIEHNMSKSYYVFEKYHYDIHEENKIKIISEIQNGLKKLIQDIDNSYYNNDDIMVNFDDDDDILYEIVDSTGINYLNC